MKKTVLFLLGLLLLAALSGCGARGQIEALRTQRLAQSLVRAGNIRNLRAAEDPRAVYGLTEGEVCAYLAAYALSADEAAVFFCPDEASLSRAKLAVSERLRAQMALYRESVPELYARLADARFGQAGKWYYLIVAEKKSADAAERRIGELTRQ